MVSLIKRTTVNVARAATTAAPMATLALLVAFGATRAVASIVVDPNTTPCVSATAHYTTIQAAVSATFTVVRLMRLTITYSPSKSSPLRRVSCMHLF